MKHLKESGIVKIFEREFKLNFGIGKLVGILFFVFFIGLVSADSATYNLLDTGKVEVQINLDSSGEIFLPSIYSDLESSSLYQLNDKILYSEGPGIITFSTKSYSDKSSSERLFILPQFFDSEIDISVILPEGSILSNGLAFPKDYKISTNGKNIIFTWENFDDEEIILFYRDSPPGNLFQNILIWFLIFILAFAFYLQRKKHKKTLSKVKNEGKKRVAKLKEEKGRSFTKNLFGDEKKILEYLLSKTDNSSWTKEMVNDLKIPKVRLSRKLRSLSEKGLIKKESHGNENRVRLVKK